MGYATLADVYALVPNRAITATSTPHAASHVERFLNQRTAEIEAILADKGYAVPVASGASALLYLGMVNAWGAAADVEAGALVSSDQDRYRAMYDNALCMLKDGLIEPVGLARDTGTAMPRYSDTATSPIFVRDMDL